MRLVAASALAVLLAIPAVTAADSFDGSWTVQVAASGGDCKPVPALPIAVKDGTVTYDGAFSVAATGAVEPTGALNLEVAHDGDTVVVTGRLDGGRRGGSWSSPSRGCDGTWTARRA